MQMHDERFPGMIEQIKQTQQQLIELTNEAVCLKDMDSFEIDAQNIAKRAFPNGDWPDDLQPWPTLRIPRICPEVSIGVARTYRQSDMG